MNDTVHPAPAEVLDARYRQFRSEQPKAYLRDAARALSVSEAELLVATGGDRVTALRLDDLPGLLSDVAAWGEVRTMTRNDHAVIEHTGRYDNLEFFGPAMGQTVGSIDLRIFANHWRHAYGVMTGDLEQPRCSIQFFDPYGVNVHKVFTDHRAAFEAACGTWRMGSAPPALPAIEPLPAPVGIADAAVDVAALRQRWDALTDTHEFHGMLRDVGASRVQAMRLAGPDRACRVDRSALHAGLQQAAAEGEAVMLFVGNRGLVQIYSGRIHRVVRTEGWLNVLDRAFNLHVRDQEIDTAWVVKKPTRHGPVTSLECYAADGETVVQLFGTRSGAASTPAGMARIFHHLVDAHACGEAASTYGSGSAGPVRDAAR